MTTHKVTLRPSNQIIEVEEEINLLEALRNNDVYIKSSCGGHATCSDCICKVVLGEDNLVSPPFEELKLLGNVFHITKERLLCQTKVLGDVVIDITKHDKMTDEDKLKTKTNKFKPKKIPTKVRSKEEYAKIKDGRYEERKVLREKDKAWEKHWEKNQDTDVKKGQGGGKRPKFFDTDKALELTRQEIEERDKKREFYKKFDERKEKMKEKRYNQSNENNDNDFNGEEIGSKTEEINPEFKKFRRE